MHNISSLDLFLVMLSLFPCLIFIFHFANSNVNIQNRTENVNMDEDPSGWRPYHTFVHTLREKFAKVEGFQGTAKVELGFMVELVFIE